MGTKLYPRRPPVPTRRVLIRLLAMPKGARVRPMGLGALVSRIDRVVGRFNRWFGPAALAVGAADKSGKAKGPDPSAVVAGLGEIEREHVDDDEGTEQRGGD